MRNRVFFVLDALLGAGVVLLAFVARFEGFDEWWPKYETLALTYAAIVIPVRIGLYYSIGLYRRLWRYASIADLEVLLLAALLSTFVSIVTGLVFLPHVVGFAQRVPIGVVLIDCTLTAAFLALPRMIERVAVRRVRSGRVPFDQRLGRRRLDNLSRVLIVGAGDAGGMVAKELGENPQLGLVAVGFLDDDPKKHRNRLHGIPVLGPLSMLRQAVGRYGVGEVIIALPRVRGQVISEIVRAAADAGVPARTVPGYFEIVSGAKAVSSLRPIEIEDLLRRDPIQTDLKSVISLVKGRVVMVTGAGGSIGRELCRQLANLAPERIIAVGRGENSIFELLQEMRTNYPKVAVQPEIVDVRDKLRLSTIFEATQPYLVFHAAAHKHVPLMESNVDEAILNNVLGTRNVAELCAEFDVEHLVLISTDKAVRPTSIMGATKRIAEQIVCGVAERSGKPYVCVRFGNVLGSRGSVVPTFMKQIEAGGPVTITHPEMRRYFMTIPEAVQLVLQAATLASGGEVFVLDMGEPMKIVNLAEDLIRLSGLEVGHDIEIVFTGMRPGEKLYEELFFGPEDATPTEYPKILRAIDGNPSEEIDEQVEELISAAQRCESGDELRSMIAYLVPEYQGPAVTTPVEGASRVPRVKPSSVSAGRASAGLRSGTDGVELKVMR